MTDKTKIADKVRALLAKAASTTNEHEAEAFLAKAHQLMEQHQFDAADLERDDPVDGERSYRRNSAAAPDWDFMLLGPVARYYGCRAIRCDLVKGYEMGLVGRESARVTATAMHKYLVATVRRLGREKAGTMPLWERWQDPECDKPLRYMNADQTARAIGNALRERISRLAARADAAAKTTHTDAGRNALLTMDTVLAKFEELHPDAQPIKGRMTTNDGARGIAGGIGLNLQAGAATTLRLK